MKNLKVFNMNLGRRYIPIRDRKKMTFVKYLIDEENYDIVMLQGINKKAVSSHNYKYDEVNFRNGVSTLVNKSSLTGVIGRADYGRSGSVSIIPIMDEIRRSALACINVDFKDMRLERGFNNLCHLYFDEDNCAYVRYRIVGGRFPTQFDNKAFCNEFDLVDISSPVGQKTHIENNRALLNHLFVSKNLECESIHKLVGMSEVAKIGEAYPMEANLSYKKVLK